MVKNKNGGNKSKSFARKNENDNERGNDKIRFAVEDGEYYALVTKMFGNGMCAITTIHGLNLIAHIRKKFTGRSKRNHFISVNSFVLIGLRLWESTPKNCDILHVFSSSDISQFKFIPSLASFFSSSSSYSSSSSSSSDDPFSFDSSSSSSQHLSLPISTIIHDSHIDIDIDILDI